MVNRDFIKTEAIRGTALGLERTEKDIKEALAGNYCRYVSYYLVIRAVMEAAGKRSEING